MSRGIYQVPQWQQDKLPEEKNSSSYTASLNSDLHFKFLCFIECLHTEDLSMSENIKLGFPKILIFNLLIFHSF